MKRYVKELASDCKISGKNLNDSQIAYNRRIDRILIALEHGRLSNIEAVREIVRIVMPNS